MLNEQILPLEIEALILEELFHEYSTFPEQRAKQFAPLLTVCKSWRPIAEALLYSQVVLQDMKSMTSLAHTITGSPRLGHLLKDITFCDLSALDTSVLMWIPYSDAVWCILHPAISRGLVSIAHPGPLRPMIGATLRSFPHLKILKTGIALNSDSNDIFTALSSFAQLEELELRWGYHDLYSGHGEEGVTFVDIDADVALVLPQLRRFTWTGDAEFLDHLMGDHAVRVLSRCWFSPSCDISLTGSAITAISGSELRPFFENHATGVCNMARFVSPVLFTALDHIWGSLKFDLVALFDYDQEDIVNLSHLGHMPGSLSLLIDLDDMGGSTLLIKSFLRALSYEGRAPGSDYAPARIWFEDVRTGNIVSREQMQKMNETRMLERYQARLAAKGISLLG